MDSDSESGAPADLPLVSVVVPFYNHESFVEETLDSVVNQDYPNMQILVSDDCSRDGTGVALEKYAEKYPTLISVKIHEKNQGIAGSVNFLLSRCRGKYVAFLGGDDQMKPGRIRAQVEYMEADPDISLCYTNAEVFDGKTGEVLSLHNVPGINPPVEGDGSQLFLGNIICSPSTMVRRDKIPAGGFDDKLPVLNDWFFFIEVSMAGRIGYIDRILTRYRRHEGNTSRRRKDHMEEEFQLMDILEQKYPEHARLVQLGRGHIYGRIAREEELEGNLWEAARQMRVALKNRVPLRPYSLLYAIHPRIIHMLRKLKRDSRSKHWSIR